MPDAFLWGKSLRLNVYREYLHSATKSINITYIGLVGALGKGCITSTAARPQTTPTTKMLVEEVAVTVAAVAFRNETMQGPQNLN